VNVPGSPKFSSYKNSLQEYCNKLRFNNPTYEIITHDTSTGKKSIAPAKKLTKVSGEPEEVVEDSPLEYQARVRFANNQVLMGMIPEKSQRVAQQRVAYDALKYLGYIRRNEQFAMPKRSDEVDEALKVTIESDGQLPPKETMPAINIPGCVYFKSFKDSVLEFCSKMGCGPPIYSMKSEKLGYVGNINFHIGYTTADQIMPTEHAAEQRAAFQALKFLRYLSPNSKFAAPAPDAPKPTPGGYKPIQSSFVKGPTYQDPSSQPSSHINLGRGRGRGGAPPTRGGAGPTTGPSTRPPTRGFGPPSRAHSARPAPGFWNGPPRGGYGGYGYLGN